MTEVEIEYHIARLIAGGPSFKVNGVRYRIGTPSRYARLESIEIQLEADLDARMEGLCTMDELQTILIKKRIWSGEKQARLDKLIADIEELKINLYQDRDQEGPTQLHRAHLEKCRRELDELHRVKHQFDHMSVETHARAARARYLTGTSLLQSDGTPYWTDPDVGWKSSDCLVEAAMNQISHDHLDTARIRLLARSDQWTAIWHSKHAGSSLFDVAAVDMTDEQRNLASWSQAYENIAQRPDGPSKSVIDDDDMLDGWMLLERRKHDQDTLAAQFNTQISDKIRGKDEVYVMMDPDARQGTLRSSPATLNKLNDPQALHQKQQKLAYLKQHKSVSEADMPDTALRNHAAMMEIATQRMRNGS